MISLGEIDGLAGHIDGGADELISDHLKYDTENGKSDTAKLPTKPPHEISRKNRRLEGHAEGAGGG